MPEHEEVKNPPAGTPVEQVAVTGRPNDVAEDNSTFVSRSSRQAKPKAKAVEEDGAENKSVSPKSSARKSK